MKRKELLGKITVGFLAMAFVGTVLTGCSSNASSSADNKNSYVGTEAYNGVTYEEPAANMAEYETEAYDVNADAGSTAISTTAEGGSELQNTVATGQKLIQNVNLEVETTDFNGLMSNVETKIGALGGYVENAYTYNGSQYNTSSESRYATITARVPADKLDQFVTDVSSFSNVISKNTSTQNVTLAYVDTESRKKMLLAEQESYLLLLEKAESVEDIVYLTSQLTEVRYEIERMESQLRTYDNLVDYATIVINAQEVKVLTPTTVVEEEKTTGQIIKEGFMKNISDIGNGFAKFGINFVIQLPNILLFCFWCAFIFFGIRLIIFIGKRIVRNKRNRKALAVAAVTSEPIEEKTEIISSKEQE